VERWEGTYSGKVGRYNVREGMGRIYKSRGGLQVGCRIHGKDYSSVFQVDGKQLPSLCRLGGSWVRAVDR
jgi:hypothetical protein